MAISEATGTGRIYREPFTGNGYRQKESVMRKKSHISVASYLVHSKGFEGLQDHRKAFYMGSILPDCIPSFITRKHRIDTTFDILKKEIRRLTVDFDPEKGLNRYFCRHLGVITHYIADYFTYPHNLVFDGSLKEHCVYEKDLKFAIREYVQSDEAKKVREKNGVFRTVDEICAFIQRMHMEYLNAIRALQKDCQYIVELCHRVVDAILQVIEIKLAGNTPVKMSAVA